MQIIEVNTKRLQRDFLELPLKIYKDDPNWIRPLDDDIESVFDPDRNKLFRNGEAIRWILKDDSGETIGRVAAFTNNKTASSFDQPTGGMGFFECVNDKKAASILFDQCRNWVEKRKMEAMDGPINFGERDKWWGLLVDGFFEPNYCVPYNPHYYKTIFESYGFKTYFNQYTYSIPIQSQLPENYAQKAERIANDPSYHFEHIKKSQLEKYAEDFWYIYNKAWVKHAGIKEMSKAQAISLMKKIKPILDEDIIWFAYHDKEAVGFFIMLPEINQIIKYLNGKLDWIGKIKFLWYKYRGVCRKTFGVAFGIIPAFQGKGLEGALVMATARKVQPLNRYDVLEMNWIGDFNPTMMRIAESIGAKIAKTHITYRKLFDETKPFKRAPVIK
ncbi:MAG: hypothetical protein FVQ77_03195 [Cytophagales bacterium]|nr:hypothetical protein [Cytophagales bacterium]